VPEVSAAVAAMSVLRAGRFRPCGFQLEQAQPFHQLAALAGRDAGLAMIAIALVFDDDEVNPGGASGPEADPSPLSANQESPWDEVER
jgi:hypothetical protein